MGRIGSPGRTKVLPGVVVTLLDAFEIRLGEKVLSFWLLPIDWLPAGTD